MEILKFKIGSLTRDEFFEFLKQFKQIIDRHNATTLKIKTNFDALVSSFDNLQAALEKEKSNELSKLLSELDAKRDTYIRHFLIFLESMLGHPDDTIKKNAANFIRIVNGVGKNIARETYLAETTMLNTVVEKFSVDKTNADELAAMNGTFWIDAIDEVNALFGSNYSQRVVTDTDNNKVQSFSVARKNSTDIYYKLTKMINGRYDTAVEDKLDSKIYVDCMEEINTLIDKMVILIATSTPQKPTPPTASN